MHDSNKILWKAPQYKGRRWHGMKHVTFLERTTSMCWQSYEYRQEMGTKTIELYQKQS